MDLIQHIYEKYPDLTQKQRVVVDFLLSNPEEACYIPLKDLSRRAGASEVSILRTCAALGFDGYAALKNAFRSSSLRHSRGIPSPGPGDGAQSAEKLQIVKKIGEEENARLASMLYGVSLDDLFGEARRLREASEVLIFGHDVSKVFADYFFHRLTFLRIKATSVALGDNTMVNSMLARLKEGDHVIVLSFPPYHLPALGTIRYALRQGASVTVITDSLESPAVTGEGRSFILDTTTRFFYNSHTLIAALINLIASCAVLEMGESYQDIVRNEQAVEGFILNERE